MFRAVRAIVTTAALAAAISTIPSFVHPAHADPRIVLTGMSPAERQMAMHAIALFEEAHLPLPPLTIRGHEIRTACGGRKGLHTTSSRRSLIDICTASSDSHEEQVMIHELAHAWSFRYMTDGQRTAFQRVRGWTVWLDYHQASWKDNGAEQAAEIIVWALSDHPVSVGRIDHQLVPRDGRRLPGSHGHGAAARFHAIVWRLQPDLQRSR